MGRDEKGQGDSRGRSFVTSGMSGMKEALVGGRVSSIIVPLVERTHICAEGWMSGGDMWYVPSKDGSLKILSPISMSG
jgi:hypothetical protein